MPSKEIDQYTHSHGPALVKTQYSPSPSKVPSSPFVASPLGSPPAPGNYWSVLCLYSIFQSVTEMESHSLQPVWLSSLGIMHLSRCMGS